MSWTLVAWTGGYLTAMAAAARIWLAVVYRDQHHLYPEDYRIAEAARLAAMEADLPFPDRDVTP